MKSYWLWVLLSCYTGSVSAQEIKVTQVHGNVKCKHTHDNKWIDVAKTTVLNSEDSIKVGAGSSVALTSGQEELVTIPYNNIYVVKIKNAFEDNKDDGFFAFVHDAFVNFLHPKEELRSASISRGKYLMLFPADNEVIADNDIRFVWQKNNRKGFHFFLTESSNERVWLCDKNSLEDTVLSLINKQLCANLNAFDTSQTYLWTIVPSNNNDNASNFIRFSFADAQTKAAVNVALTSLQKKQNQTDEVLYQLLVATVYENFKMYSMANKIYCTTAVKYHNDSLVNQAYTNFINRIVLLNQ